MRDVQPRKNRRVTACDGKVMRDAQPMKNERVMPSDDEATGDAQPRENKRAKNQERLQPAGQQFTISFEQAKFLGNKRLFPAFHVLAIFH